MKKILLANKFYYPRGGDCVYTINLERLLKEKGHDVAIFAMQHPENLNSRWSGYFPSEIDYSSGWNKNHRKAFLRPLGSKEVREKFTQLLDDFRPDIVHLNNIHTQLSPILADIASKRKLRIIWTLHDYKLLCPRADCLRYGYEICEYCYMSKCGVIKYKCTKNNFLASVLAYIEALKWNHRKLEKYTDCFICPSEFMKSKLIKGGFSASKLRVLNNFIDPGNVKLTDYSKSDYYCYIGRISPEKGIGTLLDAASSLPYTLKVIGDGPLLNDFKLKYTQKNIEFLGRKKWDEIKAILGKARFSVIPSEWYENNPLSVIESLCLGAPVLGANKGGIPELIIESQNGMLFESKNVADLKEKIIRFFEENNSAYNYEFIAETSCQKYSKEQYYNTLINDIYEENINHRQTKENH
jgi:glycosyltransferase involved in cell wall biosynthesis